MRNLVFFLLIFMTIFGFLAWAQKSREEVPEDQGVTLTDLGVTEAEKSKLRLLWELKRQKQIQAIESLKKLNRLAKDPMTPVDEIRETLEKSRQKRRKQEQQIQVAEDELIKTLPLRAQLHLTILGILENGLTPRRSTMSQRRKKEGVTRNQGEDSGGQNRKE